MLRVTVSHAKDFVRGMWLMLQREKTNDYILSTDEIYYVREIVEKAFRMIEIIIRWNKEELNKIGYDSNTVEELIFIDEKYFRPTEVDLLLGDSTKARA